jgi:two-component system LytT family response regulator
MNARRVLIVDDEPLARERVRMMLEPRGGYEIVADCGDGPAAVDAIVAHAPEIVLLDIRMPGLSGFEVLAALDAAQTPPVVIFVTAFDAHAVQAFQVGAVDYLLKPFDRPRFDQALTRAEARLSGSGQTALDPGLRAFLETFRRESAYPERFLVRGPKHLYFVRADEIEWADAQGNYVRVHIGGRAHFIRDTLTAFAEKLSPDRFIRVHRSVIVHLDHMQRLEPHGHGEYLITLRDGTRLTSSRAHSDVLHALLR